MGDRALSIGDPAAAFDLAAAGGGRHSLVQEPPPPATVVYWTCNHCPYALAWEDRIHDASRAYADRGVRFLAINSNDAGRYPADSFVAMGERLEQERDWPHPYLHDPDQGVARAFGAQKTPHVFVLDSELRLRYQGAPDSDYDDPSQDAAWLRAALDAVLSGRPPDPAETEPVGCGVKWR